MDITCGFCGGKLREIEPDSYSHVDASEGFDCADRSGDRGIVPWPIYEDEGFFDFEVPPILPEGVDPNDNDALFAALPVLDMAAFERENPDG